MTDHDGGVGGRRLVDELAIRLEVEVPQVVERRRDASGDVRVAGCRTVAGVVLESREQPGPFPAAHIRRRVVGHQVGASVEEPRRLERHLADVRFDVDDGSEDQVDADGSDDRAVFGDRGPQHRPARAPDSPVAVTATRPGCSVAGRRRPPRRSTRSGRDDSPTPAPTGGRGRPRRRVRAWLIRRTPPTSLDRTVSTRRRPVVRVDGRPHEQRDALTHGQIVDAGSRLRPVTRRVGGSGRRADRRRRPGCGADLDGRVVALGRDAVGSGVSVTPGVTASTTPVCPGAAVGIGGRRAGCGDRSEQHQPADGRPRRRSHRTTIARGRCRVSVIAPDRTRCQCHWSTSVRPGSGSLVINLAAQLSRSMSFSRHHSSAPSGDGWDWSTMEMNHPTIGLSSIVKL